MFVAWLQCHSEVVSTLQSREIEGLSQQRCCVCWNLYPWRYVQLQVNNEPTVQSIESQSLPSRDSDLTTEPDPSTEETLPTSQGSNEIGPRRPTQIKHKPDWNGHGCVWPRRPYICDWSQSCCRQRWMEQGNESRNVIFPIKWGLILHQTVRSLEANGSISISWRLMEY